MLNQNQLKQDLKDAYIEARNSNADEEAALDVFTGRLAEVFIKHIKTLEIEYNNGLIANFYTGLVTGTINHNVK